MHQTARNTLSVPPSPLLLRSGGILGQGPRRTLVVSQCKHQPSKALAKIALSHTCSVPGICQVDAMSACQWD